MTHRKDTLSPALRSNHALTLMALNASDRPGAGGASRPRRVASRGRFGEIPHPALIAAKSPVRGSVLVVVLITLLFATTALLLFIERAGTDLLVEAREADARRLQMEAYSAFETTMSVLHEFYLVGNALRSPHEGWDDPLEWAGYEPGEGRTIEVTFADESGKLSLPRAEPATLVNLFKSWELTEADSERLADALLGWMKPDYTPRSSRSPQARDYESAPLPFRPPERPLRSFSELRAIDVIREEFFDEAGQPNDLGRRFMESVSLFDFAAPNINSASEGVLGAIGGYDQYQQRQLEDFRRGVGAYSRSQRYFRSPGEVATVLGEQGVAPGFGAEIQALRVTVTVREGPSSFRLEAIVAPPKGAKLVSAPAIPAPRGETAGNENNPNGSNQNPSDQPGRSSRSPQNQTSLDYPFTLLEIRENAAIASGPVEAPTILH
jgi:hypothetical protein